MEPPVSEPIDTAHSMAASAAAEPPEEPPGILVRSCGFFVGLKAEFSQEEPMANSSMLHLPVTTMSFSRSFSVTAA